MKISEAIFFWEGDPQRFLSRALFPESFKDGSVEEAMQGGTEGSRREGGAEGPGGRMEPRGSKEEGGLRGPHISWWWGCQKADTVRF